ncbi:hypothetical protein WDU94_014594 [Cyamophila willieti]
MARGDRRFYYGSGPWSYWNGGSWLPTPSEEEQDILELLELLEYPNSSEVHEEIVEVIKSSPYLMAEFFKHKQKVQQQKAQQPQQVEESESLHDQPGPSHSSQQSSHEPQQAGPSGEGVLPGGIVPSKPTPVTTPCQL